MINWSHTHQKEIDEKTIVKKRNVAQKDTVTRTQLIVAQNHQKMRQHQNIYERVVVKKDHNQMTTLTSHIYFGTKYTDHFVSYSLAPRTDEDLAARSNTVTEGDGKGVIITTINQHDAL